MATPTPQAAENERWSALRDLDAWLRTPMLVLMNAQVDSGPVWRKVWGGALRAATVTEATGWLAGGALYPLERRLVRTRSESPTTEIMLCRRR